MLNLRIPKWVSQIVQKPLNIKEYSPAEISELKKKLSQFHTTAPLVSIVIPAWNEEEGILHTLISLANSTTAYATELIVVDNNSTDGTAALLEKLGIKTIFEPKQGIGHARTNGLHFAKGKFLLSGDSDTLYPEGWVTAMVNTITGGNNDRVHCVHGCYSFLPSKITPRWQYALYELFSSVIIRKQEKTHPHLNVLGFNCGIVRQKGIDVNGYEIPMQRKFRGTPNDTSIIAAEDGMMAWSLKEAGGEIKIINHPDGKVWTCDRRIVIDGGIKKAFVMRLKKHLLPKF